MYGQTAKLEILENMLILVYALLHVTAVFGSLYFFVIYIFMMVLTIINIRGRGIVIYFCTDFSTIR